jgi:putative ABC transport system permease protein
MLKNYFKIAWRNIFRNKTHTAINVTGLALGLTCCLFIFLWVSEERNIDNFHSNGKNLYSVYLSINTGGTLTNTYTTPIRFSGDGKPPTFSLDNMGQFIPEVKNQAFYATAYDLPWGHSETFQVGEKKLKMEGSRASSNFFTMFSFPLLEGNPQTVLKDINNVAISRKMAELFFGSPANAMGKSMRFENRLDCIVTGVFENISSQSSLQFDYLFSWEAQKKGLMEWSSSDFQTYVQLSETADPTIVQTKIDQLLQSRIQRNPGVSTKAELQLFGDRYLRNIFVNGKPTSGRIEYVRIFSGVAIFILLIACINFMNLATARSVKRAKEVGLRKVVGSTRANLIGQFFGEAIFFAFIAVIFSMLLLYFFLPAFNELTGKQIRFPYWKPSVWVAMFGLTVLTGLVAGSYPALYLSSLQPIRILKGALRFTNSAIWFRKGLTIFQFVLSVLLIISTIVITRQTNFVQNTQLGYDRDNLVYMRVEGELVNPVKYLRFKEQVSQMPGIVMVDRSSEAPHVMDFVVSDPINWQGKGKNDIVDFKPASVGFDFVKLMNLKIVEGRDFSRLNATDSTDAFMVNEEAVKRMGMKNPIGKWVSAWDKKGHIIAVLKDYHTHSLREPMLPIILDVKEYEYFGVIIVRTQAGKTKEALASMAKAYQDINPNYPFAYQFVDEDYRKLYANDLVISKLSVISACLAILISGLGLLGLVLFSAEQRIKEMGIRKVLGANLSQIMVLFSKDFLKLVIIAFLIAAPLGWYFMEHWLQDFAYRIDISWWIFALAGMVSIIIAMLTVSYQAMKSARANPVISLRTDG